MGFSGTGAGRDGGGDDNAADVGSASSSGTRAVEMVGLVGCVVAGLSLSSGVGVEIGEFVS